MITKVFSNDKDFQIFCYHAKIFCFFDNGLIYNDDNQIIGNCEIINKNYVVRINQ